MVSWCSYSGIEPAAPLVGGRQRRRRSSGQLSLPLGFLVVSEVVVDHARESYVSGSWRGNNSMCRSMSVRAPCQSGLGNWVRAIARWPCPMAWLGSSSIARVTSSTRCSG